MEQQFCQSFPGGCVYVTQAGATRICLDDGQSLTIASNMLHHVLGTLQKRPDRLFLDPSFLGTLPRDFADITKKSISVLEFSLRTSELLGKDNVVNVAELLSYSEVDLLKMPHVGKKSLNEINSVLKFVCYQHQVNLEEVRKKFRDRRLGTEM